MNRWNFRGLARRISTWLGIAGAAAGSALAAHVALPASAQVAFPQPVLAGLGLIVVLAAASVPLATSFRQSKG